MMTLNASQERWSRRRFLSRSSWLSAGLVSGGWLSGCTHARWFAGSSPLHLSTFTADVTVPLGHPLMGGGIAPAKTIMDPLQAHGLVFFTEEKPVVLVVVDWCEIRNDAHARWREVLAAAARTDPARVLVSSVHVHDAPVADLGAERILRSARAAGSVCDPGFHEQAVQRVAAALRFALRSRRPVTHVGHGLAPVEQVASNRRFIRRDGTRVFSRTSASRDSAAREAEVGVVDSTLRTLSFWQGERPLAALHAYATHPMSYYGQGGVSADFVGLARTRRHQDDPAVLQIYASGCSGNVTAGKYNDGSPANRPVLAGRIYDGMVAAWKRTERAPVSRVEFRSTPLRLEPRGGDFSAEHLRARLKTERHPFGQCLAAMGLSWRERVAAGIPLDVPVLDFGSAQLILLPAESYVEYQLHAQQVGAGFVLTLGYGECAPGYIPTETAWQEHDTNLGDWCWVAPGAEPVLKAAIERSLRR